MLIVYPNNLMLQKAVVKLAKERAKPEEPKTTSRIYTRAHEKADVSTSAFLFVMKSYLSIWYGACLILIPLNTVQPTYRVNA